jgi:ADP-ribose pyrophosphatase
MTNTSRTRAPWRQLSSRRIYANRWMAVREDQVRLPDGRQTIYGVVDCGNCVGVLPFVDATHVLLVGQYRYVAERFTWEMPTGGVRPGESLEAAAQRELAEEAGRRAGRLTWISTYHTSKSVMNETAHLYVGEDLTPAERAPDDTEFIERRVFPFGEVLDMVRRAEITDSMTVIAVLQSALQLREDQPNARRRTGDPQGGAHD